MQLGFGILFLYWHFEVSLSFRPKGEIAHETRQRISTIVVGQLVRFLPSVEIDKIENSYYW